MLRKECGKSLIVRVLGMSSLSTLSVSLISPIMCSAQVSALITTERPFPYGVVSLTEASGFTGGKYVDGYVSMKGEGMMLYPVGHKGVYHPFVANADGSVVGTYFRENPEAPSQFSMSFKFSSKASDVGTISSYEFWNIDGKNPTKISLFWDKDSRVDALASGDLSNLRILGWNDSTGEWNIIPATVDLTTITAVSSTLAEGSITTTAEIIPDSYKIYTLGSVGTEVATPQTAVSDSVLTVAEVVAQNEAESLEVNKKIIINGEKFDEPELILYPNPVVSSLYWKIPVSQKMSKLEVIDLAGRAVISESSEADPDKGLNLKHLQGGIYIVKIVLESGIEFNRKIIVKGY